MLEPALRALPVGQNARIVVRYGKESHAPRTVRLPRHWRPDRARVLWRASARCRIFALARPGPTTMTRATTAMTTKRGSKEGSDGDSPSRLIDARIAELGDWRGETLARVRRLITQAHPDVIEEWKWGGPVWSHAGVICTGETYKKAVKLTFAKGAAVEDPSGLFNSSLEGNTRRAIDLHEGDEIDEAALQALVRAAAVLNASKPAAARPAAKRAP
jgi:hypothetical protein